jgi:hypothetical protein
VTSLPGQSGPNILTMTPKKKASVTGETRKDHWQSASTTSGRAAVGTVTVYAAAIAAFSYALVSFYWALGGHGLLSTVGGYAAQFARRGGAAPMLLALAVAMAKAAGGGLALALARPWGRVIPRVWLRAVAAAASVLLIVYGALNVLGAILVLSGVLHPAGRVDQTALRWHAGVWDLWFLVWGILLAIATVASRQRAAPTGHPS